MNVHKKQETHDMHMHQS